MAKRRRKKSKGGCWCAFSSDRHGLRDVICSKSKRHTAKLAKAAVSAYAHGGKKHRYKIKRTTQGNCG